MADNRFPGEALRIRLRDKRDDNDLFELFNQERFLRYASARGPFASSDELQTWLGNIACSHRVEAVGVVENKTIGFGALYVMGDGLSHSGWILLGVSEAFQARGIGARLLHVLMATASVSVGLRRVQLTVFADNEPAIRLYRRFGFEVEGRHRDFVRRGEGFIDAFTMAKVYSGAQALSPAIAGQPHPTSDARPH